MLIINKKIDKNFFYTTTWKLNKKKNSYNIILKLKLSIQTSNQNQIINYKELISIENLKLALERTKANVSPGIDGEIKKDISIKRLETLHQELASQKYKPKPSKRVPIPKQGGGVRFLGVSSQIDKVVQGALLIKLEAVFEGIFLDVSYGFRPGKSCHHALKEIKDGWKATTWIINVDIEKCFDKINHKLLLEKLGKFCDQPTKELIQKLLKVGYVDIHNLTQRSNYNNLGTPQGSLISPILCNIYLHDLDEFVVKELIPKYNAGKARRKNPNYSKRYSLTDLDKAILKEYPTLKKSLARVKHNKFVTGKRGEAMDRFDETYRRLHYVRYADDFLIGFIGPCKEAQIIYDRIIEFLKEIKLNANQEKSKIYHSGERGIKYLGMYLRYCTHNKIEWRKDGIASGEPENQLPYLKAQAINNVQFRAPIDLMLNKLVERGLAKKRKDGTARGTAYIKWSLLEDDKIVLRFSSIIRGLLNYYSCINKRSDLWKVFAVLRKSCALTLAHKHKVASAARIYAKFGPSLTIKDKLGKEKASLFYPKSLKTKIDFKIRKDSMLYPEVLDIEIDLVPGSHKTNLKMGDVCEYEGCDEVENLEAHHLNPVGNLNKRKDLTSFEKVLIQRKRKVVMLCKKHHQEMHKKRLFVEKKNSKNV